MLRLTGVTEEETQILEEHYRRSETRLVRERAHAVLLGNDGDTVSRVSRILRRPENTIRTWFKEWNERRLASIFPKYKENTNANMFGKSANEQSPIALILHLNNLQLLLKKPSIKKYFTIKFDGFVLRGL